MNAPFQPSLTLADHDQALGWAKEWRSDCLDCFSIAERKIGELLILFDDRKGLFGKVAMRAPTRTSFVALRAKLQAKGHCRAKRRTFDSTLNKLEAAFAWRNHLSHGELEVWMGRNKRWLLTLRHPEESCTGPVRWFAYPISEAVKMRTELGQEIEEFVRQADDLSVALKGQVHAA